MQQNAIVAAVNTAAATTTTATSPTDDTIPADTAVSVFFPRRKQITLTVRQLDQLACVGMVGDSDAIHNRYHTIRHLLTRAQHNDIILAALRLLDTSCRERRQRLHERVWLGLPSERNDDAHATTTTHIAFHHFETLHSALHSAVQEVTAAEDQLTQCIVDILTRAKQQQHTSQWSQTAIIDEATAIAVEQQNTVRARMGLPPLPSRLTSTHNVTTACR